MRRIARAVAAAVLLVPPLMAGGCGGGDKPRARPTPVMPSTTPPQPVPLTLDVAQKAFQTYITDEDVARAAADERLALTWTSDGQSLLTAAEFRKAAFDGDPVRRFTYGKPKLYVPKLKADAYPQWFVASVDRSVAGDKKSKESALMGFILRSPTDDWHLTLATELAPKARLPKIQTDPDGYAEPLGSDDSTVLIRPRDVGGIQATMAAEGAASVAAKVMETGPLTSGYYQQTKRAKKKAKEQDLTLTIVYTATPYPYFGLRTKGGGGLILYSLFRNNAVVGPGAPGPKPEIPKEAEHLLDGTVEGDEIDTTATFQFAAYDPPRAKKGKPQPKAELVADDGAISKAATPTLKKP
ncbi:hypothetical protein [Actinomadura nitritigenes]|uniref:hypothetical protein n=1 Tax=Actinomadura nitritigenes TaxID=134602 RepID=UPI003D91073E